MATPARKLIVTASGTTWIKQQPVADPGILSPSEKFSLSEGDTIEINSYEDGGSGHHKIELAEPKNGLTFWYAFKEHVKILT